MIIMQEASCLIEKRYRKLTVITKDQMKRRKNW